MVAGGTVRLAFGSDEATPLTEALVASLRAAGHEVEVIALDEPWPEVGRAVGEVVASGKVALGIVCCWTGTGVAMAATKVPGVRAALCTDAETASGARRWNDANVLALGLRLTTEQLASEIVTAFLTTDPDPAEMATIDRVEPPAT